MGVKRRGAGSKENATRTPIKGSQGMRNEKESLTDRVGTVRTQAWDKLREGAPRTWAKSCRRLWSGTDISCRPFSGTEAARQASAGSSSWEDTDCKSGAAEVRRTWPGG